MSGHACFDVLLLRTNAKIRASDKGIASIHNDAFGMKARPRRAHAHRTSVVVDARDWVAVGPRVLAKARDLRLAVRLSVDVSTLDLLHVDEEAHVELSLGHRLVEWAQHACASLEGEAREDDLLLRGFEERAKHHGGVACGCVASLGSCPNELGVGADGSSSFSECDIENGDTSHRRVTAQGRLQRIEMVLDACGDQVRAN